MIVDLLEEVAREADARNWQVWLTVLANLRKPRRRKPNRSQRHRRRLLLRSPRCHYCGVELDMDTSTIDHVVPLCRGGTWDPENLVLACDGCNNKKGDQ